ncbi:MAG: hypothetical protein AABY22_13375 [Nanoarchaeota archaeon]
MKKLIVIISIIFLILNLVVIATQSSEEYLTCLSEKLYSNCTNVGIFKSVDNGFAVDYYIEPHTKESILDWLKNYETQFRKNDIFIPSVPYEYVARCIQEDDAPILRRDNFEIYTLDYVPIKCSPNVQENTFIKIIISLISINKNSKGGIIIVFSLISIGVLLLLKFIFKIKIIILIKKSWIYISKKVLNIFISKQNRHKKKSLPRNR